MSTLSPGYPGRVRESGSTIRRRERLSRHVSRTPQYPKGGPVLATVPLPQSLTAQIANELYDSILEHLHECKPVLSKFCTVSKAWLPICRRHLFFFVTLTPSLTEQCLSSSHAIKTVLPHIRSIALGGQWLKDERDDGSVVPLIKQASQIQELYFETCSLDRNSTPTLFAALLCHSQTLTTLDMKYTRFPSFPAVTQFLGSFTHLESLSLDNVTWENADSIPATQSRLLHLTRLNLVSCHNAPILTWLSRAFEHEGLDLDVALTQRLSITSLRLPEFLPSEASIIARFLRELGPSLRHLELGILPHTSSYRNAHSMREAFADLDLSHNTGLRTLEIHQLTLYQLAPSPPSENSLELIMDSESPYANLVALLSNLACEPSEVTFHLWLSQEWHLDWIDWARIGQVFSMPTYQGLMRVGIRIRGMSPATSDVKDGICRRLGPIASILQVTFDD